MVSVKLRESGLMVYNLSGMKNRLISVDSGLYLAPLIIWGSTWLVITMQLGIVDPLVSVVYRFSLASAIAFIFLKFRKEKTVYGPADHFFMALQGILLFGINYWFVYVAEGVVSSGLVALIFSVIVFFNSINGAIFLKEKIRGKVLLGGLIGIIGIAILFIDELTSISFSEEKVLNYLLAFSGAYLASLGNITSLYNQRRKIPVLHSNSFGMLYGSLFMLIIVILSGKHVTFDMSFRYISSLFYLSVFGSIIAFYAYVTVIGKLGADKAANVVLAAPVLALILSAVFENISFTILMFAGVALVITGNFIALRK